MANWIWVTQWGSYAVLLCLFVLSVWSIAIMFEKQKTFKKIKEGIDFQALKKIVLDGNSKLVAEWTSSNPGFYAKILESLTKVPNASAESIDRSVRSALREERMHLEKGLTVLATLGSNAPFIGLFGTVLGIIQAFGALAESQAGSSTIMSGISEALIATALGLFVAIPATVAYNVFGRKLKDLVSECETLRDLFLSKVKI